MTQENHGALRKRTHKSIITKLYLHWLSLHTLCSAEGLLLCKSECHFAAIRNFQDPRHQFSSRKYSTGSECRCDSLVHPISPSKLLRSQKHELPFGDQLDLKWEQETIFLQLTVYVTVHKITDIFSEYLIFLLYMLFTFWYEMGITYSLALSFHALL